MFKVRLRSSIILLIITIFSVVMGGYYLFGAVLTISMIGLYELYKIIYIEKQPLGYLGYGVTILYGIMVLMGNIEYKTALYVAFLLLLMIFYVFSYPKYTIEQVAIAFFGLFYVVIMLSYIYQVRMLENGGVLIWLVFIGAWGSDTCAYCSGMLLGKHKLAPKLSPKKSIEGSIGGIVGAALLGVIFAFSMRNYLGNISNMILTFGVICGTGSMISQVGDLAASAIKRNHDIKDYGTLIPGHGGILDRFDSIIFTAPIVYYLAKWFI